MRKYDIIMIPLHDHQEQTTSTTIISVSMTVKPPEWVFQVIVRSLMADGSGGMHPMDQEALLRG